MIHDDTMSTAAFSSFSLEPVAAREGQREDQQAQRQRRAASIGSSNMPHHQQEDQHA